MTAPLVTALLWFSIVACGLLAGVYFTFSAFAMTAFARTGAPAGVAAMTSINRVIQRSLFMPLFFGSSLSSLALAIAGAVHRGQAGACAAFAGGVIYFIGMFMVTMFFNVPRNNALDASEPQSAAGQALWARYRKEWTAWNHVRTLASTAALILFVVALDMR
ncbi:DUF1772 domain-containing protein [Sphingopyxis sp. LK2115]|uniref:anthrone oxygenase family protein n=1 Tax=Sphingopyxis sp. LK2115 TaxID=2744558 RepID=UPI0016602FB7|nr:anthrone oxygenase family protein [Sphingopyxis sp. LK2115]